MSGTAIWIIAIMALCAELTAPVRAMAQPVATADPAESPFAAWILLGVDVTPHERLRGTVRVGHLGDVDSRIVIVESTFVARPAMHVLLGYVFIAPAAPSLAGISLTRAGATWLLVRRRLTIENRFLFERRASAGTSSFLRGRNRLRISGARLGSLPFAVYGSIETIAGAGIGLLENRIQLGATRAVGRVSLESYWLRRRLPVHTVVNGVGLSSSWRIGK
jgi:hypothetical protein